MVFRNQVTVFKKPFVFKLKKIRCWFPFLCSAEVHAKYIGFYRVKCMVLLAPIRMRFFFWIICRS